MSEKNYSWESVINSMGRLIDNLEKGAIEPKVGQKMISASNCMISAAKAKITYQARCKDEAFPKIGFMEGGNAV
jgi:hypothetical protein